MKTDSSLKLKTTKPTLYVVDDDNAVRTSIASLVANWGYNCEVFASAEQYLESASNSRPGCLLLDHTLQGINGLELQQELLHRGDTIPVIVLSAFADVPLAVRYMELGAITLLEKPVATEKLKTAVDSAIQFDIQRLALINRFEELHALEQSLSDRERDVMNRVIRGKLNKIIANELDISQRTVENVRARVLDKFRADTGTELAAKATELRILSNTVFRVDSPAAFRFRKSAAMSSQLVVDS